MRRFASLASLFLVFLMAPTVSAQHETVTFNPASGSNISTSESITITFSGSDAPAYGQWYANGQPIGDAFPVAGTTTTTAPPEGGSYTLVVCGNTCHSADYTVE